jgi:hypothetical protein
LRVTPDIRLTWSPDIDQVNKKPAQKLRVLGTSAEEEEWFYIHGTAIRNSVSRNVQKAATIQFISLFLPVQYFYLFIYLYSN